MALILPMLSVVLGFVFCPYNEYKQAESLSCACAAFVEGKNALAFLEISPFIESFHKV